MRTNPTGRTLITMALVAALAACGDDGTPTTSPTTTEPVEVTTDRTTDDSTDVTTDDSIETTLPVSDELDADEVAGLLWMREEEQLAHDVYVALGDEWGIRVFDNISLSEQSHIGRTVALLEHYDLPDPAAGNPIGTFADPRIQELYDVLLAQGMESKVAALTVGATIEELDIADLRARAEATDEVAIDEVYARLERASKNHLRAFVGQLELLGVDYEPTVLDDFDEIVATPVERGGHGGGLGPGGDA